MSFNDSNKSDYKMEIESQSFNVTASDHIPIKKPIYRDKHMEEKMGYLDYFDKYLINNDFVVCSIDPGLRGGLAFLEKTESCITITTHKVPVKLNQNYYEGYKSEPGRQPPSKKWKRKYFVDPAATYELMKEYTSKGYDNSFYFGIIEQVHAFPKQGIVSTFNFGKEAGMLEALLWVTSKYLYHAHVLSWKRRFDLKGKKTDKSGFLKLLQARVEQIIKYLSNSPTTRKLVINTDFERDGELEAILILLYSLEKLGIWGKIHYTSLPKF
jgi:hypothetical protein